MKMTAPKDAKTLILLQVSVALERIYRCIASGFLFLSLREGVLTSQVIYGLRFLHSLR